MGDLFQGLGLYVERGALDRDTCAALRDAMLAAPCTRSTVARSTEVVDERLRRTRRARVEEPWTARVLSVLEAVAPRAAAHFGRVIRSIEEPQFLVYDEGGFFRPHADVGVEPEQPEHVRRRAISIVLFVGGAFRGGDLVLYGLFPDPRARDVGLPFEAEEGTLVAFPSELVHEVQPVASGTRFTIAAWLSS